jgi:WD40 repeat protein
MSRAVAFSPDNTRLAIALDRTVSVRDLSTGGCENSILDVPGVTALTFACDGRTLATGHRDGTVRIFDLPSGRERVGLRAHSYAVMTLAFSDDARMLVSASPWDTVARIWDTATGRRLVSVQDRSGPIQAATFAPNGETLATAGRAEKVMLWSIPTGRKLAVLEGHDNSMCALAFAPDGRTLAAAGVGRTVWSWDLCGTTERANR